MRAVTGSYSMPVSWQVSRSASGSSAKNRPVPMPGSSTRPPLKPSRSAARQSAGDDRLGRVVSVLRRTLQRCVFFRCDGGFERRADLLPAGAEFILAGRRKAVLRQLRRAEADEAQQLRLLVRGRGAARLFKLLRQDDRGDVVARPGCPATGKTAAAFEPEVAATRDRISRGRRAVVRIGVGMLCIGLVNLVLLGDGLQDVRTPTRQCGVVEQAEREFGIVRHGGSPRGGRVAGSRARPAAWKRSSRTALG